MGRFILTGSQQFGLLSGITQSLAAGRPFVGLLPFSLEELAGAGRLAADTDTALLRGCYPPIHDRPLEPAAWFAAYVASYVERDVRQMLKIQDLEAFQRFVKICAGRSGQLLNLSASRWSAESPTTRPGLGLGLEASYLVFLLRPHHANFNKRLVKTPKLYFYDTGLLSWLLGIRTPEQMETHPLRGSIFETMVVSELAKARVHRGVRPALHFWRDSNGNEVDVIAEDGDALIPIEIKSGKTVTSEAFASLERWRALAGKACRKPTLVHGGTDRYRRNGMEVMGWRESAGCWRDLCERLPESRIDRRAAAARERGRAAGRGAPARLTRLEPVGLVYLRPVTG